jgi:hypothetical protein
VVGFGGEENGGIGAVALESEQVGGAGIAGFGRGTGVAGFENGTAEDFAVMVWPLCFWCEQICYYNTKKVSNHAYQSFVYIHWQASCCSYKPDESYVIKL